MDRFVLTLWWIGVKCGIIVDRTGFKLQWIGRKSTALQWIGRILFKYNIENNIQYYIEYLNDSDTFVAIIVDR